MAEVDAFLALLRAGNVDARVQLLTSVLHDAAQLQEVVTSDAVVALLAERQTQPAGPSNLLLLAQHKLLAFK